MRRPVVLDVLFRDGCLTIKGRISHATAPRWRVDELATVVTAEHDLEWAKRLRERLMPGGHNLVFREAVAVLDKVSLLRRREDQTAILENPSELLNPFEVHLLCQM